MNKLPSTEYLNECFQYVKATGELIWKTRPLSHFDSEKGHNIFNSRSAGTYVGNQDKDRSKAVILGKHTVLVAHIVWKMMHGTEHPGLFDYKDGNHRNTSIDNLIARQKRPKKEVVKKYALKELKTKTNKKDAKIKRVAYKSIKKQVDTSPLKYTTKVQNGLYVSRVLINGKQTYLGRYETELDAHTAAMNVLRIIGK